MTPVAGEGARRAEPPAEFDTYQFVLLRRPKGASQLEEAEAEELQSLHLGHLVAMKEAGLLRAAGPLREQPDQDWRGICIYQVATVEEARRLAELDPSVRAGQLAVDVMIWLTPKGSLLSTA
jgi:uncharacterized protein YciI